jgi:menaquinone-9 beta-reductase
MNLHINHLPASCDVLIIGAGPAGSAAAITLARSGWDVVLIDQHSFPRDKVCGDGLIPDAHHALRKLGVLDEVMAAALCATHVACIGPRGGRVDVPGDLAVLPRKQLDDIVCRAAVAAGARMFAPLKFVAPLEEAGAVVGAQLQGSDGRCDGAIEPQPRELRARWVLLATGAVPQGLLACGMSERHTPSGVALRGYVKNDAMVGRISALEVVWSRVLTPGYGWIFPCPGGVFNIGVGVADSHNQRKPAKASRTAADRASNQISQQTPSALKKREVNLRQVMDDFQKFYPPARDVMQGGTLLGPMKGAPLRCSLEGARYTRPGLMVVGEAAGTTYSFSGEGIGKALESGIHAAEAMVFAGNPKSTETDSAVRADYEARLLALKPRFQLYQRANLVNRHPWLADLLIWRANKSPRIVRRMSGVLNETSNPGHLLSVKGIYRLFTE